VEWWAGLLKLEVVIISRSEKVECVSPNRNVERGRCGYEIAAVENAMAEGMKRER
jgi:hypothetical protein